MPLCRSPRTNEICIVLCCVRGSSTAEAGEKRESALRARVHPPFLPSPQRERERERGGGGVHAGRQTGGGGGGGGVQEGWGEGEGGKGGEQGEPGRNTFKRDLSVPPHPLPLQRNRSSLQPVSHCPFFFLDSLHHPPPPPPSPVLSSFKTVFIPPSFQPSMFISNLPSRVRILLLMLRFYLSFYLFSFLTTKFVDLLYVS